MAKITREQLNKINAGCKNGFALDLYYFILNNEKRLIKEIEIDGDSNVYQAIIEFNVEYESYRKIGVKPVFIIKKLVPAHTKGMYSVTWIKEDVIGEMIKRCNMKLLQEYTKNYNDENLVEMIIDLTKVA